MTDSSEISRWIRCARKGDKHAQLRLYDQFLPVLSRYVTRRLGRIGRWIEVDDVTNRAFFEVLRGLKNLPTPPSERDFLRSLYITSRSRVIDAVRKYDRHVPQSAAGEDPDPRAPEPPSMGDVTLSDEKKWIRTLVASLPAKYAEVVRLCALEEVPSKEAARRLGLPVDTVHKRYERARKRLSDKAGHRHPGP